MKKGTYIDLSQKVFNHITILSYNHTGRRGAMWNCACKCGNKFIGRGATIVSGHTTSCGCIGLHKLSEHRKTHGLSNTSEYKTWKDAKSRAKKRNVPFNIEVSDIVIPDNCPVLAIPIYRTAGKLTNNSPSLDCFYPENGYVKGNVWVISQKANTLKNNLSLPEWKHFVNKLEENSVRFTKPTC